MSIKLPVITSNFELYKNVIERYESGFCINPFDPDELADKIQIIFENKPLANKLSENPNHNAVNKEFNWGIERINNKFL